MKTVTWLALLFLAALLFAPLPAGAQTASEASSDSAGPSRDSGRFVGTPSTGANNSSSDSSYDSTDDSGEYCIVPSLSSSGLWSATQNVPVTQDSVTSASGESSNELSRVIDWNEAVALGHKEHSSTDSPSATSTARPSSQPLGVTSDDDSYAPTRLLDWDAAVQLGYQEKASMTSSRSARSDNSPSGGTTTLPGAKR